MLPNIVFALTHKDGFENLWQNRAVEVLEQIGRFGCFFLMIVNISLKIKKPFYKLIALGLGTEYAFQVFLTVGGATKFIPMTGVTLPLVSYGGSSVASTVLMLAIIQGLYILREDEDEEIERQRRKEAAQRAQEAAEAQNPGYY